MWIHWVALAVALLLGAEGFRLEDVLAPQLVERHPNIISLMNQYIQQHNRHTVLSDPHFCNRTYALGLFGGPQTMGNRFHEFTNSFAFAVVTNRTIFKTHCNQRYCRYNREDEFIEVFDQHDWMLTQAEFKAHWERMGCVGSSEPRQFMTFYHHDQAEEVLTCCGVDTLDDTYPVLWLGTHDSRQAYTMIAPSARLNATARHRALTLFSAGDDVGYGILIRAAWSIKPSIRAINDALLAPLLRDDPFIVGVHIRHASHVDVGDRQDISCQECVHKVIDELAGNRPCLVLLASDRSESFLRWEEILQRWNNASTRQCRLVYTNHTEGSHLHYSEHGPFTGYLAVLDVDLLSRAHAFVGSTYLIHNLHNLVSTFSLTIAALKATNGLNMSEAIPPVYQPWCKPVVEGRWNTKEMLRSNDYVCKPPYLEHHISMPPGCLP